MKKLLILATLLLSFNSFSMVYVSMETTKGTLEIELDDEKAPISVENFLNYVDTNFYAGTIFHRTVPNFVIQAGGHLPDMTEKPTNAPIKNECLNGLSNLFGTLGMARTEEMDSATSQFYINTKDNVRLDKRYAVFGRVIGGEEIMRSIEHAQTTSVGEYENVPVEPIIILSITRRNSL